MSEKNAHKFLLRMRTTPHDRLERIENVLVPGMPDVNGCFDGREFWIETKQPREPVRASTPLFGSNHDLSQDQLNWFLRQRNAGGNGIIYVQTDKLTRLFIGAEFADIVNEATLKSLQAMAFWNSRDNPSPLEARERLMRYCVRVHT
jgi:hypothetical protein